MKTEEQLRDLKAAKGNEYPDKIKGYDFVYKEGFIDALKWVLGD